MYTMWYERVSRWYDNWWYEKTLVQKTRYSIIKKLKAVFVRFGMPDVIVTDNGPQFS